MLHNMADSFIHDKEEGSRVSGQRSQRESEGVECVVCLDFLKFLKRFAFFQIGL